MDKEAKDQLIQALEQEKKDLSEALKARNEEIRAYAMERREVERSLGESLMELTRQLEVERSKQAVSQEQIASLRLDISALQAEIRLLSQNIEQKDQRLARKALECEELDKTLSEQASKLRAQLQEKLESDRLWGEKMSQQQKILEQEREARLHAEQLGSDLRAQLQTLTDHLSRVLREKESDEGKFAQWDKEREQLLNTLRKKDEMIAMLSATFQNLLKKPELG
jgi:chromosome segregation ATPase